jgi:hypothetical protein
MDGEMLKNETRIKHESLDREIGDENPMSLRRLPHAVESDEKKTPAQPIRLDQRTIPHEISPVSTQGFLTECALRDFIHEGLAQFCLGAPRSDATVGKITNLPSVETSTNHTLTSDKNISGLN